MEQFTVSSKMSDVFTADVFAPLSKYLIYSPNPYEADEDQNDPDAGTLAGLKAIGWSPEGIAAGLNFLKKTIEDCRMDQFFIYEEADCADDAFKKDVNLIRLCPEKAADTSRPAVILCAGGAYNSVCTMVEALPTARHFVEAGFTAFLFTYRVGRIPAAQKALDDLAAAIRYLSAHAKDIGFDPENYVIGGFSAGANLISNWGTSNNGWKHYGLAKPKAMLPVYTFIDLKAEGNRDENGGILGFMCGRNWKAEADRWNVAEHIDADYPPCYITAGKDDATVPPVNSEKMAEALRSLGIPVILDEGEHAPHGFGDGTGTDVEGWPERAIDFIMNLC